MSYDIELVDPVTKEVLHLSTPHQMTGGTYAQGGTTEASLNVTYNYSKHYKRVFGKEGIRTIYGMSGVESIPILKKAISKLLNGTHEDYWKPTEGNAKRALYQLLALAQLLPYGVWNGD